MLEKRRGVGESGSWKKANKMTTYIYCTLKKKIIFHPILSSKEGKKERNTKRKTGKRKRRVRQKKIDSHTHKHTHTHTNTHTHIHGQNFRWPQVHPGATWTSAKRNSWHWRLMSSACTTKEGKKYCNKSFIIQICIIFYFLWRVLAWTLLSIYLSFVYRNIWEICVLVQCKVHACFVTCKLADHNSFYIDRQFFILCWIRLMVTYQIKPI